MSLDTQNMQIIGLVFDAAGISILGLPAAFRMVKEVNAQMTTYYDFNTPLGKALAQSRVDITLGSILLLIGFVMQLTGLLGYRFLGNSGVFLMIALVVIVAWYWTTLRRKASGMLFDAAVRANQRQKQEATGAEG